jgi:hypothetical protein
MKDAR